MPVAVRRLVEADLPTVLRLNNAAVPAVPAEDRAGLDALVRLVSLALVAESDDGPAGFLLAMEPGVDHASENYRWFSAGDPDFLYVDRIVVDAAARGGGIGAALYAAAFEHARRTGRRRVTCEVNVRPENPGSLRFHARLGFERVGEQETKGGSVRVALLAAPVGS